MALATYPAPSTGKTRYLKTLLSGTSWTVPAGVTQVIATLVGGGSGSYSDSVQRGADGANGQEITSVVAVTAGASIAYAIGAGGANGSSPTPSGAGGNTTFAGATTANGGVAQSATGLLGEVNTGRGAPRPSTQGNTNSTSPCDGASGRIDLEWWV